MSTDVTKNENQLSNVVLTDIVAPSLSDVSYASSLNEVFTNINNNFGTLANREFVKGDGGDSVEIIEWKLFTNGSLNNYGELLKEKILELLNGEDEEITLSNGEKVSVWDKLYENNNDPEKSARLYMVCNMHKDYASAEPIPVPITSLYFVFLDGRYNNDKIGLIDQTIYNSLNDASCILVYNTDENGNGKFIALENAFPTIYYENGIGLCWKVNGNGTGIPVQGIPGKDGSNASIVIVQAKNISESTEIGKSSFGEVAGIYEDRAGYREIPSYKKEDLEVFNNQSALILASNESRNDFYFGKINIDDDGVLRAYFNPNTSINSAISTEEIINSMKNINILGDSNNASSGMKGLFIPLEKEKNDGSQKVHLLSATSITNNASTNDLKTDVLFTPVENINDIHIDNSTKKLNVEKYLYVKVNKEHAIISANSDQIKDCNYLKYKLDRVVLNADSDDLGVYNGHNSGSRYYGNIIYDGAQIKVNENNTCVVNREGVPVERDTAKYGDNIENYNKYSHLESMPEEFYNSLAQNAASINENTHGIYRWVLETDYAKYDPDELTEYQNGNNYTFPSCFNTIYTTTVTPSTSTKFMWFNGMMVYDGYNNEEFNIDGSGNARKVIPGWTTSDEQPLFIFLKFVPVYANDFSVNTDTALNLNYNVNITGDADNPNKSITVHGNVNCDNLSVYKLTATGEIQNIYTKDDITAEKGINLGKNTDTGKYNTTIDVDGNITAKSISLSDTITAERATINSIDAVEINGKDLDVNVYDNNSNVVASAHMGLSGACDKAVGVTLTNVHEIDVIACEHSELTEISKVPVITSNVPAHLNDNGNVVISNQANDSSNIYFKDTLKNNGYDPGSGVSSDKNIHETSFESAKNFNMHRLSLQAEGGSNSSEKLISNETKNISTLTTNGNANSSYAWAVNQNKGQGSFDGWKSDFTIPSSISAYIDKADNGYIKDNYLQRNAIQRESGQFLSTKNNIDINLTNYFWLVLGIWTGCSYGKWGLLHSDSYMRLRVYYSTDGGNAFKQTSIYRDYKFDHSTSSTADDSGFEWVGVNIDGSSFGSGNYDTKWRYRSYVFKPSKFTITSNSTGFDDIVSAYNSGKSVEFRIVPTFKLRAHAQKSKDLIGGICVTCPRPIEISDTSGISSTKLISGDKYTGGKRIFPIYKNVASCTGSISYTVTESTAAASDVKATTICNDGMVVRAGGYVFGLGYAENAVDHERNGYTQQDSSDPHWKMINKDYYLQNIPVLFYYKHNDNYYNSDKSPKSNGTTTEFGATSSKGYATRMNAIPLEDIFKAVEILRSNEASQYGL